MKKVLVGFVSAAALTTASLAMAGGMTSMAASDQSNNGSAAGIFISGNLGYGKVDMKNTGLPSSKLRGFTWNASLGYQFNKYFALETGYTQFHGIDASATTSDGAGGTLTASHDAKFSGISLLAKGIYPISSQFNVFAKAGAMYLNGKTTATKSDSIDGFNISQTGIVKRSRIVPEFGVGTSYNMTQKLALTLQGITTLKSGSMPATYAAYAGLSYKFNV